MVFDNLNEGATSYGTLLLYLKETGQVLQGSGPVGSELEAKLLNRQDLKEQVRSAEEESEIIKLIQQGASAYVSKHPSSEQFILESYAKVLAETDNYHKLHSFSFPATGDRVEDPDKFLENSIRTVFEASRKHPSNKRIITISLAGISDSYLGTRLSGDSLNPVNPEEASEIYIQQFKVVEKVVKEYRENGDNTPIMIAYETLPTLNDIKGVKLSAEKARVKVSVRLCPGHSGYLRASTEENGINNPDNPLYTQQELGGKVNPHYLKLEDRPNRETVDAGINELVGSDYIISIGLNCAGIADTRIALENSELSYHIKEVHPNSHNDACSHEKKKGHAHEGNTSSLADEVYQLGQDFSEVVFLGGCCGTNGRYIKRLSKLISSEKQVLRI